MELRSSAHTDTFARDRLPPPTSGRTSPIWAIPTG